MPKDALEWPALFCTPKPKIVHAHILDIGNGKGIWAMDVADIFPSGSLIADTAWLPLEATTFFHLLPPGPNRRNPWAGMHSHF
ncbi:uncharacterized protein AKAW2_51818S [Aspergillus luchuensis]|uniref:Uncharacterized protein n=1 Tax=Aspergillus kawachii TaxID=1069201 RepID=A0A7R7WEE2_ASPKA|nr:uncharacterized protein AKAW2_51818S [Aspergillus luchuensis]BCS01477.1 hypothetical protein AKAW2_51818S [Aspergillus luchuensis]